MGAFCSRGIIVDRNPIIPTIAAKELAYPRHTTKHRPNEMHLPPPPPCPPQYEQSCRDYDSRELALSGVGGGESKGATATRSATSKGTEIGSILGRAGAVGLERAVEVLDTLGSSMSNLHSSNAFVSGMATRGNKISILAFEVANTIARGASLMQSLSPENMHFLIQEILHSEGVKHLVSADIEELLCIAAADKREELNVFSGEVIRFGNLCKDPQWHNLGRYFEKLDSVTASQRYLKEEAEDIMQQLLMLAQNTAELYHESNTLDRFDQDYRRKLQEEESLNVFHKGDALMVLRSDLKRQRKFVRSLRKKCLWSKSLEEVVEKLVDIVNFLYQEITEVFGIKGPRPVEKGVARSSQSLGVSGLALHYANIINQIDSMVSRPSAIAPNLRDALYHGLPNGVKTALRSRLQSLCEQEELTLPQIKSEMDKMLKWFVPLATNTTKAHQGFGWVGEWANNCTEVNKKTAAQNNVIRLQTLYHANKKKTDECILELVTWLHRLVVQVQYRDLGFKPKVSVRSPTRKILPLMPGTEKDPSPTCESEGSSTIGLSEEDNKMLEGVCYRKLLPGISKSQEFDLNRKMRGNRYSRLSRSIGSSPTRELSLPSDLECEKIEALNIMDGLNSVTVS